MRHKYVCQPLLGLRLCFTELLDEIEAKTNCTVQGNPIISSQKRACGNLSLVSWSLRRHATLDEEGGTLVEINSKLIGLRLGGALAPAFPTDGRTSKTVLLGKFRKAGIEPASQGSKQAVVQSGLKQADDFTAKGIAEDLLKLLDEEGLFSSDEARAESLAADLKAAFESVGAQLEQGGVVTWEDGTAPNSAQASQDTKKRVFASNTNGAFPPTRSSPPLDQNPPRSARKSHSEVESVGFSQTKNDRKVNEVVAVLERIPTAARALTWCRSRSSKSLVPVADEYDAQDFASYALRVSFEGVTDEEPGSQTGGKGYVKADFALLRDKIWIEVKVAKANHAGPAIKEEIAADQAAYRDNPQVETLIVAVYDLDHTLGDKAALKRHIEDSREVNTRAVILDWQRPKS